MSASDDTPPSGHRAPVPRPSSRTVVGLGTLESDPPTTPPRGLDLRGADTSMVLTEMRAEEARKHARLERIEGKVDALIDDVRGLDAHQRSLRATVDRIEEAVLQLVATTTRTSQRVEDIARRLGVVERAPREGSSPQLEALAKMALEDAETEVRRRRAQAAEEEQARALRQANRSRLWSVAWKVVAVVVVVGHAVVTQQCGG